jgi:NAD(P)H-hydrate repair Nnr-like enzyme with NAD(P)H-hydrate dehydratase domain
MIPAAFIAGMLSLAFPFSLISLVGRPFGELCCIGLDKAEIARNRERVERFQELVAGGMSPEDAKQQLEREAL